MAEEIELNELQLNKKKVLIEKFDMLPEDAHTIAIAEDHSIALQDWKTKQIDILKTYTKPDEKVGDIKSNADYLLKTGLNKKIMSDGALEAKQVLLEADKFNEDAMFSMGILETNADTLDYGLLLNLRGVATDAGVDNDIRTILSFSFRDEKYQSVNLKKLIKNKLIKDGTITEDFYKKNAHGIQISTLPLQDGSKAMVWRILPIFGGDGQFRPVNKPGIEEGDFKAMSRGSIEFGAVMAAFLGGSVVGGPVVGGPIAAGIARWAIGVKTDLIGKYHLGLDAPPDNVIYKAHITPALLEAGAGIILGKVFQMMKLSAMGENKVDLGDVKNFVREYVSANPGTKKAVDALKNTLITKYNIAKDKVDEYLALSVAQMFPNMALGYKTAAIPKAVQNQIDDVIKKSSIAAEVETSILKTVTGGKDALKIESMDSVDSIYTKLVAADKIHWDKIGTNKLQNIKKSISILKGDTFFKPSLSYQKNVGLQVSELIKKVNNQADFIDNQILAEVKRLNLKVTITDQLKKDRSGFMKIIGAKGSVESMIEANIGKAPIKPKDYLTNKVAKAYYDKSLKIYADKRKAFTNLGTDTFKEIQTKLRHLYKTLSGSTGQLTYENLNSMKGLILNAELSATSVIEQNALRYLKGTINASIYDIGVKAFNQTGSRTLLNLVEKSFLVSALQKNSIINEVAQTFGYMSRSKGGPVPHAMALHSENIFLKYFSNTANSRANAEALGTFLNDPAIATNLTMRNTIKGSVYEYYENNVIKGTLSHADFIKNFGKNAESVLGKADYKIFSRNANLASKQMDKFYKVWGDKMSVVARYLQIDPSIPLKNYTPEFLASQLIKMGGIVNMQAVKNALGVRGFKSVQNHVVKTMYEETSIVNNITQLRSYNGALLLNYIKNNQAMLRGTFGDDFVKAHTDLAKVLMLVQNTPKEIIKKLDASMTQKTSLYGMFIDIFYGPLNHKRLILNRMARIYDAFDIDQSTYSMMFNYQLFLENAKRNFIMGSYPKVLDDALKGQQAKKRFRDLILNYKIPKLWDNRNVWNVGGPFKQEFTNLVGVDVLKPIGVAWEVFKKPNWSIVGQRVGIEELLDKTRDQIPGEADLIEEASAPLHWAGSELKGMSSEAFDVIKMITSSVFEGKSKKLPETIKIEEKLKELDAQ